MKEPMWKRRLTGLLAAALVFSAVAGSAGVVAKSDSGKGSGIGKESKVMEKKDDSADSIEVDDDEDEKADKDEREDNDELEGNDEQEEKDSDKQSDGDKAKEEKKDKKDKKKKQEDEDKDDEAESVTDAVYGTGKHGKGNTHGLLNALKNLEGKPAEAKVLEILKDRGVDPADLAQLLEQEGDLEAAVEAQEEAVASDPEDVESVKKLAKLMQKKGEKGIKTFVNGKQPKFDVKPFKKEGRTLVPFRAMAEALSADVKWDAKAGKVTVARDHTTVELTLGSSEAIVNGEPVKLDVPAQMVENRVVIPMRFLSEAFGAVVTWDQETQSIIITEKTEAPEAETTEAPAEETAEVPAAE